MMIRLILAALCFLMFEVTRAQDEAIQQPEQMPVALSCLDLETQKDRDQCTAQALTQHVINHLEYPKKARRKNISGMLIARFVVHKNGQIGDVEILKSPDDILDDPVKNAIFSMPEMHPGEIKGQAVAVQYVLPIRFTLEN
jgi:protein TonB